MDAETVLNLLDSYWYDLNFFNRPKPAKNLIIPEIPFSNQTILPTPLPTIHTKPSSSSLKQTELFSGSPNSVLQSPKLQTIFSGKQAEAEVEEFELNSSSSSSMMNGGNLIISRTRKKKRLTKSLSDLEFEELKGFMDLGFVFSEDDKDDSILGSIIPGLQRLNKNNNNNINNKVNNNVTINDEKNGVIRPYLSEAWEVLEKKERENNAVIKWKVPVSNNQIDMKGYLKSWAHVVASTVKS